VAKASDNEFPSLLIKEGSAPASPAAGDQRLFIDSADHLLKIKNSSGTVSAAGYTDEQVRDVIGAALVAGTNVTITVNDAGDTITIAATGGGSSAYIRNRVMNGNFRTNQRAYASAASLSSGAYAFDRWKATTASTTLTFTAAPQGQAVTINSGGSIAQVIERANLEAGTFTLSWAGTATGRAYKVGDSPPAYAASPITVTPDGSGDYTVEFTASGGTKTLSAVQLEAGSSATAFEVVSLADELLRCQRYYIRWSADATATAAQFWDGWCYDTTHVFFSVRMPIPMRAVPAVSSNALQVTNNIASTKSVTGLAISTTQAIPSAVFILATVTASVTAGTGYMLSATGATGWVAFDAEL
jgi:hypothetical protein